MKKVASEKGFTLIEIIAVLILVSILAVFAGMGIVSIVEGFFFTKMNAATVQKGQAAIVRLDKEFSNITSVSSGNAASINFTSYKQGVEGTHVVSWAGNDLTLDGDTLTDNVSEFDLGYYDSFDGAKQSTWSSSRKVIEITLKLKGANDVVSEFKSRVVPRNL